MTRKELEQKITKALHKANRAKTLKLKLEKVHEAFDVIQRILAGMPANTQDAESGAQAETSSRRLEQYLELCHIHTLKYQLDALLHGVMTEHEKFSKQPEQMTQERFDSFLRRLNVVLDTDPEHPEALEFLQQLTGSYPQYAESSNVRNIVLDVSQYQQTELSVAFECSLTSLEQSETLAVEYKKHTNTSVTKGTDNTERVRLRFSLKQLERFAIFHEELRTSAGYKVFVNGRRMKETSFTDWFHCHQRRVKADTPHYCYGASPFTVNVFGCHKVSQPDIAGQLERCWFHQGVLEEESGLFLIATEEIAGQIRQRLHSCGFCPFLTKEKLRLGIGLLPQHINPQCDERWTYLYEGGRRVGVVPSGSDIAIARRPQEGDKIDPAELVEVSTSPYADRMLEYVKTHDKHVLNESRYKGITRCLNCGTLYKAHTLECPGCKSDFVKNVLADPDKILRELSYIQPVKYAAPARKNEDRAPASAPQNENRAPASAPQKAVSFDQLWEDPQILKILSNDSTENAPAEKTPAPPKEEKRAETPPPRAEVRQPEEKVDAQKKPQSQQKPQQPPRPRLKPQPLYEEEPEHPARRRPPSANFDFHGKLRGLISKKYRERKAIEDAFSSPEELPYSPPQERRTPPAEKPFKPEKLPSAPAIPPERLAEIAPPEFDEPQPHAPRQENEMDEELLEAIKRLRPRQRSGLSKRGVVRVIYHATMDKDECPLCAYLDGMVMDPDDPGTDIFSPPLYPGCTCSREYVLKTEKPSNWPDVSFRFPPKELLGYLKKY